MWFITYNLKIFKVSIWVMKQEFEYEIRNVRPFNKFLI